MGLFFTGSVSSKRMMNLPPYFFTYSELTMIPRALPNVGGPLGLGAKRITTPFSAPSRLGSPLSGSFFSESCTSSSGAISSSLLFHSSGLVFLTSAKTSPIRGETSFARLRSSGRSPMSLPMTAPALGAALYFTAFCSAYFSMRSLISSIEYLSQKGQRQIFFALH